MGEIDSLKAEDGSISRENIKKILPYEDSFLYIDKVLSLDGKNITVKKEVRADEYWAGGHFSGFPIMPGALIVEGLGQAATLLVRYNLRNHLDYDVLAYKIRGAKFFRPTFPGHELIFRVRLVFRFRRLYFVKGEVLRKEKIVAKAKMVLAIVDKKQFREKYSKK